MTFDGASSNSFMVRSAAPGSAAGLFTVSGRHDLGGGWSIGADARALVGGDGSDVQGSLFIGRRF